MDVSHVVKKWTFPFVRQFDQMDCGPACISMVARHYGKIFPLSYLRSLSCLSRKGVSIAGIRRALREIKMESASFEMSLEQLRENCPLPAIVHWEQNHFVVLYAISKSRVGGKYKYHVANPAYGKHRMNEEEFCRGWVNGCKGIVIAMEPSDDFFSQKSIRDTHSFYAFAHKYIWTFKHELLQLALGLLAGTMLSLVAPFLTQAVVDNGIMQRDIGVITAILLAQLFLFFGSFSMGIVSSWVTLYMGTKININILFDYLSKLLKLPISFFETKSVGDYSQRIADHSRLQSFTTQMSLDTAFSILSGSILLVIIGYYSMFILAVYLSLTALSAIWMSYFWNKRKALDYEVFKLASNNQNKMYEMMSGIIDIKINSYSEYKVAEWKGLQDAMYRMSQRALKLGQVQNTGYTMIGQLRNIIVTFWIALEVVHGDLTLGMMMSISSIIGQVNGPLSQLIGFLQQFQDAKISLERSQEVLLCPNEDNDNLDELRGNEPVDIWVENVSFQYNDTVGSPALENVSFSIPAGKTTALVGESGSGKTTLMKLLLRFYAPSTGNILFGNVACGKLKAESIRKQMGIVMQENFIFSDTIKQNIILGEIYDEQKMKKAIDMACLGDYIKKLPLGIETKIGTDGTGVSGGEKQRIMIARAIYKNPLYLLLDEATSSLDAENERNITENLSQEFHGRTMLVIAHRLSTVRDADNIIVLRHGKVVETGNHKELVGRKGYYYELVKNQLELAKE